MRALPLHIDLPVSAVIGREANHGGADSLRPPGCDSPLFRSKAFTLGLAALVTSMISQPARPGEPQSKPYVTPLGALSRTELHKQVTLEVGMKSLKKERANGWTYLILHFGGSQKVPLFQARTGFVVTDERGNRYLPFAFASSDRDSFDLFLPPRPPEIIVRRAVERFSRDDFKPPVSARPATALVYNVVDSARRFTLHTKQGDKLVWPTDGDQAKVVAVEPSEPNVRLKHLAGQAARVSMGPALVTVGRVFVGATLATRRGQGTKLRGSNQGVYVIVELALFPAGNAPVPVEVNRFTLAACRPWAVCGRVIPVSPEERIPADWNNRESIRMAMLEELTKHRDWGEGRADLLGLNPRGEPLERIYTVPKKGLILNLVYTVPREKDDAMEQSLTYAPK